MCFILKETSGSFIYFVKNYFNKINLFLIFIWKLGKLIEILYILLKLYKKIKTNLKIAEIMIKGTENDFAAIATKTPPLYTITPPLFIIAWGPFVNINILFSYFLNLLIINVLSLNNYLSNLILK